MELSAGESPPNELAADCINALEAASTIPIPAGLARLVDGVWASIVPTLVSPAK
jgi:hypothetical protein